MQEFTLDRLRFGVLLSPRSVGFNEFPPRNLLSLENFITQSVAKPVQIGKLLRIATSTRLVKNNGKVRRHYLRSPSINRFLGKLTRTFQIFFDRGHAPDCTRHLSKNRELERKGSKRMKYTMLVFLLGAALCGPATGATGAQMTLGDLHKLCTSPNESDKSACRFYILGVFEGAQTGAETTQDKAGHFQERRDKPFCVPEGLASSAMELAVKLKMGSDLAVFPEDRNMPAVSFLIAVITQQFPCQKAK